MSVADDKPDLITLIWNDLFGRYEELKKDAKHYQNMPRVVVVGQLDAEPGELFAALLGDAVGQATYEAAAGAWGVWATFALEDVPGGGLVGAEGSEERALAYLREADAVVLCLLRDRRPTELESGLYEHMRRLRRVNLVVVNTPFAAGPNPHPRGEADDLAWWDSWATELRRVLNDRDLVSFRVRRLHSRELVKVARNIHERLAGELQLKFISQVRHAPSRDAIVADMVNRTSRTAAFLGLNPIPYADIIAITPVQVLLVCRVAAAHGRWISAAWAKDFLTVCAGVAGAGIGFKALYRRIKRSLGKPGLPVQMGLGAGVAWTGTQVIGRAAQIYFRAGGTIDAAAAAGQAAAELAEQSVTASLLL